MIGQRRTLPPIEGDSSRWYIPGRALDFQDRFSLTEGEFHAISFLIPLVAQLKGNRFEVACMNKQDARDVSLILEGIRSHALHEKQG